MLGSGRSSLSSSVRSMGKGGSVSWQVEVSVSTGQGQVGPGQTTPGCSTVQNSEGTWCISFLLSFLREYHPLSGNPSPENQVPKQLFYPLIKNLS